MSDRIAVMSQGVIQQVGDGATIYDNPATPFVASFVGENNAFNGAVKHADGDYALVETRFGPLRGRNNRGLKAGDRAILFVRPEALRLSNGIASGNVIDSTVTSTEFEGHIVHVYLKGDGRKDIALSISRQGEAVPLRQGDAARVAFDARHAIILPAAELARD